MLRDYDICPSLCSKHRLLSLIGEINSNAAMPHDRTFSAPARASSGPRMNTPMVSKIPVLIDSSPVRVVRSQVGRMNEHGTKQDFLDFHGFLRLLWRIACLSSTSESPGSTLTDTQRVAKLLFRMERYVWTFKPFLRFIFIVSSSDGRSAMSKRGNKNGKSLAAFVITDWSFSPILKNINETVRLWAQYVPGSLRDYAFETWS